MKVYLLVEAGDRFYIEAENKTAAKQQASLWGAEVLAGPLPQKYKLINPYTISVVDGKIFKS